MSRVQDRSTASSSGVHVTENPDGLSFTSQAVAGSRLLLDELTPAILQQLEDDGRAIQTEDGLYVSWDAVYEAISGNDGDAARLLGLPPTRQVSVKVYSRSSLEDASFSMAVGGWRLDDRAVNGSLTGAILEHETGRALLPQPVWRLVNAVRTFADRGESERSGSVNRQAWGEIRRLALDSHAELDDFLHKTVVLTPQRLDIDVRRVSVADDTVIELAPGFEGAPIDWLDRFDRSPKVLARYDIPTVEGVVQVVVSPSVRTVLEEIKRLPNRRVAGARAQAFIKNPFAALGEDATTVINEDQFEQARLNAGLTYERFLPQFERDSLGYPVKVGLLVERASPLGPAVSESHWLDDRQLQQFVTLLARAVNLNFQLLAWEGFDLELDGDVRQHLQDLSAALEARLQPAISITFAQVYDLTRYSQRIEGIGFEKAYYSPHIIKKKDDEGWFPENVVPVICWTPEGADEPVALPLSEEARADLQQKLAAAEATGKAEIHVDGCPTPLPVAEARRIVDTFVGALTDVEKGIDPTSQTKAGRSQRKSPVVRANIEAVDYSENRSEALAFAGRSPQLPSTLRENVRLLEHQREGIAWLQALFEASEGYDCRGAVLADDMGLGKTLQLLIMVAQALEHNPNNEPVLVVAPVSLLENWKEEVQKFFIDGALPILTAYGDDLVRLRIPRESVDKRLQEDGLIKFLRPDWIGDAKLVLTTYETLRDLEFSFAMQRWSIMICDEAQKIKNPSAMMTRAAKKQNVRFKIACTGTPVENTLADIWCLFDFVQPGLLGALNDFGLKYRRPIEARTEEEKTRVEELRQRIAPQILRRTKQEVAKDLPRKIVVDSCRRLPISSKQRELYANAIEVFKKRRQPGAVVPFKNHLGLLHYLRLICTDPRRHGLEVFAPEALSDYRLRAPKIDWLLGQLGQIQKKEEKVIVFCEFRNIQRLLQHYIAETFGFRPDIINGDTTASAGHSQSRQKRIRSFQDKQGFDVLILSPIAVGFGVNIQAANHVVHYTRTWNPAKEDQATDRAYRIGQTKDVQVYYPVVCADDFVTFDVRLDQLLESKRSLAHDMLNGAGEVTPGDFTIAEVVPGTAGEAAEHVTHEDMLSMNWEYFEALAAVLYARRGNHVRRTPGTKDHGVDVVAISANSRTGHLIQTKSSGGGAHLDWDAVKEVVGGQAFYNKLYPGVAFAKVCVTNRFFNGYAHKNAALNEVQLIEQPELIAMLKETPVTMLELERVLFPEWSQVS